MELSPLFNYENDNTKTHHNEHANENLSLAKQKPLFSTNRDSLKNIQTFKRRKIINHLKKNKHSKPIGFVKNKKLNNQNFTITKNAYDKILKNYKLSKNNLFNNIININVNNYDNKNNNNIYDYSQTPQSDHISNSNRFLLPSNHSQEKLVVERSNDSFFKILNGKNFKYLIFEVLYESIKHDKEKLQLTSNVIYYLV